MLIRVPYPDVQAVQYDSDSQAAFNAMTVQPDDTQKSRIDRVVRRMKAEPAGAPVWGEHNRFWLASGHDDQGSRVCINNPSQVMKKVNSPAFTAYRGFRGDGAAARLDTLFADQSTEGKWGTDGTLYVWVEVQGSNYPVGSQDGNSFIGSNIAAVHFPNSVSLPNSTGLLAVTRQTGYVTSYKNGSVVSTRSGAATTPGPGNIFGLAVNLNGYSTAAIGMIGIAGPLTSAQHAALYSILSEYRSSLP